MGTSGRWAGTTGWGKIVAMTKPAQHSDAWRPRYPAGTTLGFDASVRLLNGTDGDVVLMGGSPLRLLRLRPRAREVVEAWQGGDPIGAARSDQRLADRLIGANIAHPRIRDRAGPSVGDVTIVIPVHNRSSELGALLESVGDLSWRVAEVIVVDDGSSDDVSEVARRLGATVVRRDVASGPGAARNAGLKLVDTPFVAFLDSDCIASSDWLDALLPHFADDQVAILAPRVASSADLSLIGRYEAVRSSLDLGSAPALVRPGSRVAYVPAAALVARTAAIRNLGGFAEAMHVGEDVDLIWRTIDTGHTVRYEPTSVIHHRSRTSLQLFAARRYAYGSSAGPLERRHPGRLHPMVLSPWSAAAWAAVATGTPLGIGVGAAIATGSAAALPAKLTMVSEPRALAWTLAARGHLGAGEQLTRSLVRSYLPLTVVAAVASRRARRLALASLVPYVVDWRRDRRADKSTPSAVPYVGLRLVDDGAYCLGVWRSCLAARMIGPLTPRLQNWPGRQPATEDGGSWGSSSTVRCK